MWQVALRSLIELDDGDPCDWCEATLVPRNVLHSGPVTDTSIDEEVTEPGGAADTRRGAPKRGSDALPPDGGTFASRPGLKQELGTSAGFGAATVSSRSRTKEVSWLSDSLGLSGGASTSTRRTATGGGTVMLDPEPALSDSTSAMRSLLTGGSRTAAPLGSSTGST